MAESIFSDKSTRPDTAMVIEALDETVEIWETFRNDIEEQYGPLIEDWKFYSKNSGWLMKVLRKKRNLFFMIPMQDFFRITFIFGDRAVAAINESDLPDEIKTDLNNARKYMEGRGIQIPVNSPEQLSSLRTLIDIKIAH